jgi:hypothetical protein
MELFNTKSKQTASLIKFNLKLENVSKKAHKKLWIALF